MINSVIKYHKPQMNADKRRFIVSAISSSPFLTDPNQKINHFFVPVKNMRLSIIFWFENHKEHRGPRENRSTSALEIPLNIFYDILKVKRE